MKLDSVADVDAASPRDYDADSPHYVWSWTDQGAAGAVADVR